MTDLFTTRKTVNTLFGPISVDSKTGGIDYKATAEKDDKGNDIVTENGINSGIGDYILRDPTIISLQREIKYADIKSNMKLNPVQYIGEKNEDLVKIAEIVRRFFKKKFMQYLQYGYTQKEAEVRAKKDADHEEANLMVMHKTVFPKDVNQLNLDRSF